MGVVGKFCGPWDGTAEFDLGEGGWERIAVLAA